MSIQPDTASIHRGVYIDRSAKLGCAVLPGTIRLFREICEASRVFASVPPALRSWFWLGPRGKRVQNLAGRFGGQIFVEIIVNGHHGSVATGSLALDLYDGEFAIFGGVTWVDATEVLGDRLENIRRAAEHAWRCRTYLYKVGANGFPIEHSVERGDFVDTHGRKLEKLGDIVHHTDARPSLVLPLAQVEKGNDRCLLVLWWISRYYFLRSLQVVRGEFKRDLGVVVCSVAVDEEMI